MKSLTPKKIFDELNKYVIGQNEAKRIISIAFRDRYRRLAIKDQALQSDIIPKNVLLIGPTGIGKTEIVKRSSVFCKCPFIKVEATRFTEIGYVGKDVEIIIKELLQQTIDNNKHLAKQEVHQKAKKKAEDEIIKLLISDKKSQFYQHSSKELLSDLKSGKLDNNDIEIEIKQNNNDNGFLQELNLGQDLQIGMISIVDGLKFGGDGKKKFEKMKISEAMAILIKENTNTMINESNIIKKSIKEVEDNAVVFIDEIDKIISSKDNGSNRGEISREGVQRDLLPIIEGTLVNTKHGYVNTRHILFIGCGAFYNAKPSDLLPELQGRFPVRATLENLNNEHFYLILTKPTNNLLLQYQNMFGVEDVELKIKNDAIKEMALIAHEMNINIDNIGARRLHNVLEKIFEEISFNSPCIKNDKNVKKTFIIDKKYVKDQLKQLTKYKLDNDKYII